MSRLKIVNVVHGPTVLLSATGILRSQVTRIKVCIRTLYRTVYILVRTAFFWDNLYQVQTKTQNNIKVLTSKKSNGPNQDSQNILWLHIPKRYEL
jgi:hypothetical protein